MPETLDEEYWDINGTPLHRLGWSVMTMQGLSLPPLRGQNSTYALKPGQEYREKVPDATTLSLPMWVVGVDPANGTSLQDPKVQVVSNIHQLNTLMRPPGGGQVAITRRQKRLVSATPTLFTSTAFGECVSLTPSLTGRTRAELTAEFLLAIPYFFGTLVNSGTINVSTPTVINNAGDDIASWFNFETDLVGPLTNPRVTITNSYFTTWVQYNGSISGGVTVTLNNETFTAVTSLSANVIDKVSHAGKPYWLGLHPGNNTVTLTADSGAGSCVIRFKPPYF